MTSNPAEGTQTLNCQNHVSASCLYTPVERTCPRCGLAYTFVPLTGYTDSGQPDGLVLVGLTAEQFDTYRRLYARQRITYSDLGIPMPRTSHIRSDWGGVVPVRGSALDAYIRQHGPIPHA